MEIFTSREIATGFWFTVLLIFVLATPGTRKAAFRVIVAAFDKRLLTIYAVTSAYILLLVLFLTLAGYWTTALLKSTLFWFFSIGLVSLFRISQIMDDFSYFRKTVLDNLKFLIAVEFIISTYTLALWQEFVLMPFLAFVSAMLAMAEIKPEYQTPRYEPVKTLLRGILTVVAIFFILSAIVQISADIRSFVSLGTLSDFLLPLILTCLFLPYLYLLAVYAAYETVFSVMPFSIKNDDARNYAHFASIMAFRTNVKLLRRWQRDIGTSKPTTKDEVRASIRNVLDRLLRERNPQEVSIQDGWSPYAAKDFMQGHELKTGEYHEGWPDSGEWYAASPLVEVGDGLFPNNIAYYVDGNKVTATQLKLAINVNDPPTAKETLELLTLAADDLTRKALNASLPMEFITAIFEATDCTTELEGKSILLRRENFRNKTDQYKLSFTIKLDMPDQ